MVAQLFAQLRNARGRWRDRWLIRCWAQRIHGVWSWAFEKPGIN